MKEIGGGAGDFLCSATKDQKHVMQDESFYEPCFFNTSYVFCWPLSKWHATKTTAREARYITSELGNTKIIQNDVYHPRR